jgi:hypothetical protein
MNLQVPSDTLLRICHGAATSLYYHATKFTRGYAMKHLQKECPICIQRGDLSSIPLKNKRHILKPGSNCCIRGLYPYYPLPIRTTYMPSQSHETVYLTCVHVKTVHTKVSFHAEVSYSTKYVRTCT